jgi:protein-S-isoprenylcysteine O-methyltransferase Ste14
MAFIFVSFESDYGVIKPHFPLKLMRNFPLTFHHDGESTQTLTVFCDIYMFGAALSVCFWPDPGPMRNKTSNQRWWIWVQNLLTLSALVLAPLQRGRASAILIAIGGALMIVGAAVGIMGVRALGKDRSPHPEPRTGAALVRDGVYAIVRHPLYVSLLLVTLGWSAMWSSFPGILVSAGLALLLDLKSRLEERYLTERFPEYRDYAATVARFLPGIY